MSSQMLSAPFPDPGSPVLRLIVTAAVDATRSAVHHFVPWSRHPDNTIDNLVAAHSA